MANEATESDSAEAPAVAPAKAANPWIPLIAMLVLMPAVTLAMVQFVIVPKIRGAVLEPLAKTETAHGAKEAKSEKGKGEGKTEHGLSYDFDNIVVNLSGAMGTRYLKTSFTAQSENPELKQIIEENKKQLLDVTINVLGTRSLADLEQPGAKNVVRNELIANLNQALNSDLITQIYFSEFVVQ